VGEGNLGCAELVDSHRPESFRMKRFAVANEQKTRRGKSEQNVKENPEPRASVTALRVVRPAQAVRVEMRGEQPARVYLRGTRGEVIAASGPWRSSGDWWQEDAWRQNEWDLAIAFPPVQKGNEQKRGEWPEQGLYRIYYDELQQEWFLRGVYD
jgi:protein ImuB